jgi:hypothetical protein
MKDTIVIKIKPYKVNGCDACPFNCEQCGDGYCVTYFNKGKNIQDYCPWCEGVKTITFEVEE